MRLVHDAGSLVFVWEHDRLRMILHAPDVRTSVQTTRPRPVTNAITPTEQAILPHLVEGLTNPEIAVELGCSAHVVHFHIANILRKLGAKNRVAAAVMCVRRGLVT